MLEKLLGLYRTAIRVGQRAMNIEDSIPRKFKNTLMVIIFLGTIVAGYIFLRDKNLAILQPRGTIGIEQRKLIYFALLLSAIVVLPVFFMAFFIYNKYKDTNTKSTYQPEWDHNKTIETVWWGVPVLLISILSVTTWTSSHSLDPYRSIPSSKPVLRVQVIALDWKWLFLYPDQHVATLNYVQIPVDTPVDFEITSDAPMNSFWIPQLGSQVYAMSGMTTHLNAMATAPGSYNGASANISGKGFAGMKFVVDAVSMDSFNEWSGRIRSTRPIMDQSVYAELARQSEDEPIQTFSYSEPGLYDTVVSKYMSATDETMSGSMEHMDMEGSK